LLRESSPSSDAPLRFAGRTHVGRRGGENEDSLGWDPNLGLWLVADGMGGHAAGQVASGVARDAFLERAAQGSLQEAVMHAHKAVVAAAAADETRKGMGTTLVAVRVVGDQCNIVWVGDSRAYRYRHGSLEPMTRDHSFLEHLRERKELSPQEIQQHPNRNLVTQSLGIGTPVPSSAQLRLRRGDRILLCSDGLNEELTDAEIAALLRANELPDRAAEALIAAALDKGGRDNVTVVVIDQYADHQATSSEARANRRRSRRLAILAGVGAALGLLAAWWLLVGIP